MKIFKTDKETIPESDGTRMKRKFRFTKWTYLKIICGMLLFSILPFCGSCRFTFRTYNTCNEIYIQDLATGEPVFGARITEKPKRSPDEGRFDKDLIPSKETYDSTYTYDSGSASFHYKGSSYACVAKKPGSKFVVINKQAFVLKVKELKCDSYPGIFSLNEDGTLNVNNKEIDELSRAEQNYVKAAANINKMDYLYFSLSNDGKENFRLTDAFFTIKKPKHIVDLSKYFVSWEIGEPLRPKKMLVGLDTAKPFKITEVKVEPEGLFTVELAPATSLEEVKDYSIAKKYGIKNVYILTVTPKTTEFEFRTKSISFKTEPAVPDRYIEPYFEGQHFSVKKPNSTGEQR